MTNLRPGSRLIAGATLSEVQTDAGSLCLKEPDHDDDHDDDDDHGAGCRVIKW